MPDTVLNIFSCIYLFNPYHRGRSEGEPGYLIQEPMLLIAMGHTAPHCLAYGPHTNSGLAYSDPIAA